MCAPADRAIHEALYGRVVGALPEREAKDKMAQKRSGGCFFPGGQKLGGYGLRSRSTERFGGSGNRASSPVVV